MTGILIKKLKKHKEHKEEQTKPPIVEAEPPKKPKGDRWLSLTERQFQVLNMYMVECFPMHYIAKRIGCSVSNVSQILRNLQLKYPDIIIKPIRKNKKRQFKVPAEYVRDMN